MAAADLAATRAALLHAVARGRVPPPAPVVRAQPASSVLRPEAAATLAGLHIEELQLCTEILIDDGGDSNGLQAWVPLRLAKLPPAEAPQEQEALPAVLLLHATGVDKDSLAARQAEFARRGYLAAALDCRYHGERADPALAGGEGYQQALVRAWRGSGERPFLLDNVWDILRTLDYLQARPDVDAARIGLTGVSLGGMHTWLAAAVDERVAAAAPMIGVQYFGWAVRESLYHARVESIPLVFQAAAADLALQLSAAAAARQQPPGSSCSGDVTPEVVTAVWNVLLPGMLEVWDAPYSLPLLAPRPLLIANGQLDPRCPMQGLELALESVRAAYSSLGAPDLFQLYVEPGCGHECTEGMWQQVFAFMDRHLLRSQQA
ncbi:hypothetical protein ABPG77_006327 [Micractinium sp. CCAP 211/92]